MLDHALMIAGGLVLAVYVVFYPNPYYRDRKGRLPWHDGYEGDRGPR